MELLFIVIMFSLTVASAQSLNNVMRLLTFLKHVYPGKKTTEVNCSKTIVFEVILQFTIVNYSNTTIYYSITIVLLGTIILFLYTLKYDYSN